MCRLARIAAMIPNDALAAFVHLKNSSTTFVLYSPTACATLGLMQRKKIDLKKVLAAMNTTCPGCRYEITPAEIQRIDFERMRCPKCRLVFDARKVRKAD